MCVSVCVCYFGDFIIYLLYLFTYKSCGSTLCNDCSCMYVCMHTKAIFSMTSCYHHHRLC